MSLRKKFLEFGKRTFGIDFEGQTPPDFHLYVERQRALNRTSDLPLEGSEGPPPALNNRGVGQGPGGMGGGG